MDSKTSNQTAAPAATHAARPASIVGIGASWEDRGAVEGGLDRGVFRWRGSLSLAARLSKRGGR